MKKLLCLCLCLCLAATVLISCTDDKKDGDGTVVTVTDENGDVVTDANGEPVTEIVTSASTGKHNGGLKVEESGEGLTIYFDDMFK